MPNSNARSATPERTAISEAARDVKTQPQVGMSPERVSTPELGDFVHDERYDNMPCTD